MGENNNTQQDSNRSDGPSGSNWIETVRNESHRKLLERYDSVTEFRIIESERGQVSPAEMRRRDIVRREILYRMGADVDRPGSNSDG